MELHAWINPFRAGNSKDTLKLAATQYKDQYREALQEVIEAKIAGHEVTQPEQA